VGGHRPIVWGGKSNNKKINNVKYIMDFGSHILTSYHTTTNQKHTGMVEASVERRLHWAGSQGVLIHRFCGRRVNRKIDKLKKIDEFGK
jgi:hypothetical protein